MMRSTLVESSAMISIPARSVGSMMLFRTKPLIVAVLPKLRLIARPTPVPVVLKLLPLTSMS